MLRLLFAVGCLRVSSAVHLGAGSRFPALSLRRMASSQINVVASATATPADAVSFKSAGLCKKLEVPSELLDNTDVFIFDCDGVIWKGDSLIDGVPKILDMLRKMGKTVFFVTNNSTKSRKGYLGKFTGLGLNVKAEEIFSSSFAAAAYLEQTKFKETGKKVYIIGEVGIQEELDLVDVPHIGGPEDSGKKIELKSGYALPHDEDVGAVIVGFDRDINYHKIQYAQLCINENPGCEFIATNLDAVTHLTDAQEWAGNGAMDRRSPASSAPRRTAGRLVSLRLRPRWERKPDEAVAGRRRARARSEPPRPRGPAPRRPTGGQHHAARGDTHLPTVVATHGRRLGGLQGWVRL